MRAFVLMLCAARVSVAHCIGIFVCINSNVVDGSHTTALEKCFCRRSPLFNAAVQLKTYIVIYQNSKQAANSKVKNNTLLAWSFVPLNFVLSILKRTKLLSQSTHFPKTKELKYICVL